MAKDFQLYEQGELVGTAESLTLSVGTNHKKFKLEDIDILPNFHLINDSTNIYSIKFIAPNASGIDCEYEVASCTFTGRSNANEDYSNLSYIEGNFDNLYGNFTFDKDSSTHRSITNQFM